MRFNVGVITKDGFVAAHVLYFENGIVLRSKPIEWLGIDETKIVADEFEAVVESLKSGNIQFDETLTPLE